MENKPKLADRRKGKPSGSQPVADRARDASPEPLSLARHEASRGMVEAARDALIVAWRRYRDPRIADLVDWIEAEHPSSLQAELAGVVRPTARESLARLERLTDADDPRVSRFALDRLAALPFTTPNARAFLDRLVDVVEAAGDARLLALAPGIVSSLRVRITRAEVRDGLIRHLDAVVAGLTPVPALAPELASELHALEALLSPLDAARRLGETLLASIYEDPEDDARRAVYGDWLCSRSDPRGELIQLQLQRRDAAPTPTALAREAELLKTHGRRWLGPLLSVLSFGASYSATTFERGFVSKADIILSVGKKLTPLLTDPGWATVEHLVGWYTPELVEQAPLRALRSLERPLSPENVRALAQRREPLRRVDEVTLVRVGEHVRAELLRAFPKLTRATLSSVDTEELVHAVELELPRAVIPLGRASDDVARSRREDLTKLLLELPATGSTERSVELKLWTGRGAVHRVFQARAGRWLQTPDAESTGR